MFTGAVYAVKGFFMQQAGQSMFGSYLFHYFHNQLIVICCIVGSGIDSSQFMLGRRHLIVSGFG